MGFITRPACWLSDSYLLLLRTVGRGVVARDWFVAESSKKKKGVGKKKNQKKKNKNRC